MPIAFKGLLVCLLVAGGLTLSVCFAPAQEPTAEQLPAAAGHDHHDHDHGEKAHRSEDTPSATNYTMWLLIGYSGLIIAASLFGGFLPSMVNLTHNRMQLLISLVGGLMLGIGVFHMLPHALVELGPGGIDTVAIWMMIGMVVMFFLLRAFHFHQHGPADFGGEEGLPRCDHTDDHHAHDHGHHHHGHHHSQGGAHRLGWVGVFFGLALHTLIDGMALGASIQAESGHVAGFGLFGLGTFAAIALHKPLDAVSITSLMTAGGWSTKSKLLVNLLFSMMCPLGAVLFVVGVEQFFHEQALIVGASLAFAAGVFICISLSDLLPEMEFHSHHRLRLSVALLLGIAMAWGIRYLEPAHAHDHHGHDAHGHEHHDH